MYSVPINAREGVEGHDTTLPLGVTKADELHSQRMQKSRKNHSIKDLHDIRSSIPMLLVLLGLPEFYSMPLVSRD